MQQMAERRICAPPFLHTTNNEKQLNIFLEIPTFVGYNDEKGGIRMDQETLQKKAERTKQELFLALQSKNSLQHYLRLA